MGILDSFFSFLDGGDEAPVQKLDLPDYDAYWKQYKGWIQNINERTTGQLADVRARLSAAGADPDMLMMQTEHLESQRTSEIAKLEGGPTKRYLDEAFQIATGKRDNPYSSMLPGMATEPLPTFDSEGLPIQAEPTEQVTLPATMEEYFTKFYNSPSDASPETAGAEASKRAKIAAGGVAGGSKGSSGVTASNVFSGSKDDSFWR